MVFLALVAVTFVAFAVPLVSVFTKDAGVVPVAASALRLISYGYVFYAWGMVIVQAFNGAGDTYTPTVINIICHWAWQIPLAWFLSFRANLGPDGVFLAIVAFRRGKWKEQII